MTAKYTAMTFFDRTHHQITEIGDSGDSDQVEGTVKKLINCPLEIVEALARY